MTLPTGTFSDASSGLLQITLSAKFASSKIVDAGFPSSTSSDANLALRAYAGPSGSPRYSATIDKYGTNAYFDLFYPGGGVEWPVGVEEVAHKNPSGGIWGYSMNDITLTCVLIKR